MVQALQEQKLQYNWMGVPSSWQHTVQILCHLY